MADFFSIVHQYWMLFLVGQYPHGSLGGLANTLLLSAVAMLFAVPLGVALALARISPFKTLRVASAVWVYLFRGIPLMMVVFWTYFCVPMLLGRDINGFATMACTLVVYESAYIAEIVRGGIQALPSGQYEASRALGMSYFKALRLIILPQALYNTLPSLISQLVSIIKDSTLGYVINVQELTFAANQVSNQLLTKPFQVFAIVALSYYVICFSLTWVANRLEKRITQQRNRHQAAQAVTSSAALTPEITQ